MITQLLIYSLKASLILMLCYVPYMLILRHERYFKLNRAVLLAIIALSLVLPLFNISWMSLDHLPVMQATYQQMAEAGLPVQTVDMEAMTESNVQEVGTNWFDIIAIVFFAGMVFSILFRFTQMGALSYILSRRNLWTKKQDNGILVCCRKGSFSPYSWMNRVVISENDWDENAETILLHETGHIKAGHSYDQLLLLLCQAVMWYNPFAWLLGYSLEDVHEYEADDYVLRQGVDAKSYMLMLVMKVAKWQGYSFVNSLNKSTLNKRILMMKTGPATTTLRKSKILYLLPICALGLSVFATPKVAEPAQKALLQLEQDQRFNGITNPDVAPRFGENEDDIYRYLFSHVRYPQIAQEYGITGQVWVEFVVNPDGTLSDIKGYRDEDGKPAAKEDLINGIHVVAFDRNRNKDKNKENAIFNRGMQELMNEAVRVIEDSSGQWKPGYMQNDDGTTTPIPVRLCFPIVFRLS